MGKLQGVDLNLTGIERCPRGVTIWYKALDIVEKHSTREVTHGSG
jgi:hypothetical protein